MQAAAEIASKREVLGSLAGNGFHDGSRCKQGTGVPGLTPGRSEDQAGIAFAPGDVLAVKVFEKGNGVFSGDAGPFFERSHVEALRFTRGEEFPQIVDRGAVKDEIVTNAGEALFAKQQ